MTSQELVEKLNASDEALGYGPFIPVDSEGKIIGFFRFRGEQFEERVSHNLAEVGIDRGWLAEHPEGFDRGGYCAFVWAGEAVAFFHGGEWQAG